MKKDEYKLKSWWWNIFMPSEMEIDQLVLVASMSREENKEVTDKLRKEFRKKYYNKV